MTHPESSPEQQIAELQQQIETLKNDLQAQQRTITLFSEAPAPYLLLNTQGRVEDVNIAGCALLRRTREALLGKRLQDFLVPASRGTFELLLRQTVESGLHHQGEGVLQDAEGASRDVLLDFSAERLDGTVGSLRLIVTDISLYKKVHRDLLDASSGHEQQLEEQTSRVRALNQELEQVVAAFSQQLHLPLARAMNFLGVARRALGDVPDEVGQPLLHTERAIQQLIALLASVERYMQVRGLRVRVRPVELDKVLREVLKAAQPVMVDRKVRLTHDPLPTLPGDHRALYVVLDEYVANALKYTKGRDEARIHIQVRETESEVFIGVEDNGTGFNMRQKDKLFQLFGRLHSSKDYEGTGIGLVTVRRACERFGGRVWAEGKVDQGATFWFAWPKQPRLRE